MVEITIEVLDILAIATKEFKIRQTDKCRARIPSAESYRHETATDVGDYPTKKCEASEVKRRASTRMCRTSKARYSLSANMIDVSVQRIVSGMQVCSKS